jgi:hypothetical protein
LGIKKELIVEFFDRLNKPVVIITVLNVGVQGNCRRFWAMHNGAILKALFKRQKQPAKMSALGF